MSCTSINKYLSHCLNNIIMPLFNVLQTLGISETNMSQTLSEKSSLVACQILLYYHTPQLIQIFSFPGINWYNSITAVQLLLIKIAWIFIKFQQLKGLLYWFKIFFNLSYLKYERTLLMTASWLAQLVRMPDCCVGG